MRVSSFSIGRLPRKVWIAFRRGVPWNVSTLLLAASLTVLPACSTLTGEEPPATDSTLVEVLVELNLAKARAEASGLPEPPPALRDSIFAHYGLSASDFQTAMDAYARHPNAYAELYTAVLDRIEAERYGRAAIDDRAASE